MPKRIQRKRSKGWRAPEGAVYVSRPSKWGNPFRVGPDGTALECVDQYRQMICANIFSSPNHREIEQELRGKDLMCWCPLADAYGNPVPCHADVLLKLANE